MIETRHGLESNPVPTSILSFIAIIAPWGAKMDVGTGLDSRPCLVSIIFADLTSLHPPSFFILTGAAHTVIPIQRQHAHKIATSVYA